MNDRQQEIDEYRERQAQAFYAEAFPCENCGRLAGDRFYDLKHELWIGVDLPLHCRRQSPS